MGLKSGCGGGRGDWREKGAEYGKGREGGIEDDI